MNRYVCVHGHFYQPPRENPWLETIEQQDSAWPFHDWNERINAECYAPNTTARMLDGQGRITGLANTYARISFNIGPTLLAWMQDHAPETYEGILAADRESLERFGGHGSALAQVYNHMILPLATRRDKRTQIRWGLTDFRTRFGRDPEGMWLAETAVDVETLDLLAEHGIAFTILSPYQAARTRPVGSTTWRDATHGHVDTTMPYTVGLPSGRSIVVFFYDGPISRAVAFEGLLDSGDRLSERLLTGFRDRDGAQLVHIATDGESYGHHHRHGEMALAHALLSLDDASDVTLTNYGRFLELHPPTHEAEVVENSSWSCAHGVERWRSDCGCTTGGGPDWNQAWRAPLRESLDWLREELVPRFEDRGRELFRDPWAARDEYIEVVLDRSPDTIAAFLSRHSRTPLRGRQVSEALKLLEMQRHAMLMYTSCGWFFEELSRIEAIQVLHYAARAIQLAGELFGDRGIQGAFLERLEKAPSNVPQYQDGRTVYELMVEPSITDLEKVAAHVAIAGLFRPFGRDGRIGCYEVEHIDDHDSEAGRARLLHGRVLIRSTITREQASFEFGVVHLGDHNIACGIRPRGEDDAYHAMSEDLMEAFGKADFPETIRGIDEHFGSHGYSLRDLFRDEQRRIIGIVLDRTVAEAEASYRSIYRGRAPLMRFLADLGAAVPAPLQRAAEVVLNAELREAVTGDIEPAHVQSLIEEATRLEIPLETDGLAHALDGHIHRTTLRVAELLEDPSLFEAFGEQESAFFARIHALVDVAATMPFEVDLGHAQNVCYRAVAGHREVLASRARGGDVAARQWVEHLDRLATRLGVAPGR